MDLGIRGKKAIVAGGSADMGKGAALALAHEGVELFISARTALTNYTAVVSRQLAKHNVVLNNVLPGIYETDGMYAAVADSADKLGLTFGDDGKLNPVEVAQVIVEHFNVPTGTLGQPNDIGQFVAMLCSKAACFTVGQNIVFDGGMNR